MIRVDIKPLSVNEAWQGKRFKTNKYKQYERDLMLLLPARYKVNTTNRLKLRVIVGVSSKLADIDNILKPFIDILQKKYVFNDRNIYRLEIVKMDVKKGEEYISFSVDKII